MSVRAPRRDALRNRDAVLAAATEVLSEAGTEATVELIAARAGVGVGTVYRHFPNKDALVDTLVRGMFEELVAAADEALARTDGTGLQAFLTVLGASMARHRGWTELLVGHEVADCGADLLRRRIAELVRRAAAAGELGPEVTVGDVMTLIWALRGIIEAGAGLAPTAWQRHLDIHLAALRAPAVPSRRRSVSPAELARIAAARRAGSARRP